MNSVVCTMSRPVVAIGREHGLKSCDQRHIPSLASRADAAKTCLSERWRGSGCSHTFFVTTVEFLPTLTRQRDDAENKGQVGRQKIFDGLLQRLDNTGT